jgi:hypothetical protein
MKLKVKGKKTFHPKTINWSNLYLGRFALTNTNRKTIKVILQLKISSELNPIKSQPPKKKITNNEDISKIFPYSPKKNIAKIIDEYSTLYPATNSASASGKSLRMEPNFTIYDPPKEPYMRLSTHTAQFNNIDFFITLSSK